jgi:hypothetical protein
MYWYSNLTLLLKSAIRSCASADAAMMKHAVKSILGDNALIEVLVLPGIYLALNGLFLLNIHQNRHHDRQISKNTTSVFRPDKRLQSD